MLVMHCSDRVYTIHCMVQQASASTKRERERKRGSTPLAARWLISFVPTMNDTIYLNGMEIGCTRALFTHNIFVTSK